MALHDVVRHLVLHGPARNEAERERLLAELDEDERGSHGGKRETKAEEKAK